MNVSDVTFIESEEKDVGNIKTASRWKTSSSPAMMRLGLDFLQYLSRAESFSLMFLSDGDKGLMSTKA